MLSASEASQLFKAQGAVVALRDFQHQVVDMGKKSEMEEEYERVFE
jgi:hypothetical protein